MTLSPPLLAAMSGRRRARRPARTDLLAAWYSADQGVTLSGSTVSVWADRSGNGRTASQATGSKQPLLVAGAQNGLPVIRFDGIDDCLATAAFQIPNGQAHVIYVVKPAALTDQAILETSANYNLADAIAEYIIAAGGKFSDNHHSVTPAGFNQWSSAAIAAGTWYSVSSAHDRNLSANEVTEVRVNGVVSGSRVGTFDSSSAWGTEPMNIGSRNNGAQFALNGDIAEILLYHAVLADSDRAVTESYLRSKWAHY